MAYDYSSKAKAGDYDLIAMSWHEAGHTICGLFNFLKIYHIYVTSDKYKDGKTLYEIVDSSTMTHKLLIKILLIYEIQTLYAGLVCEKMYYKEICGSDAFPMHLRIGSSNDFMEAAQIIDKNNLTNPGKERFLFKKQAQNDAKNILSEYWDDTKLVAHELYKHKELSYEEVKYLLTRKSLNKDFWKSHFKELKLMYSDNSSLNEKDIKDILTRNTVLVM